MGDMRNVNDIRNQVNLYFDNALGDNESQELLSQVDIDPKITKIFRQEKTYRDFIKKNVTRPAVSSDFIQTIKDRIRY